ncbi:MAG: hypothetical protein K2U26_12465 [Cyclobacteriaceae bacterium]|nr:hypothetical protein [Cyclobacteriaceae bacterium]
MSLKTLQPRTTTLIIMIVLAAAYRLFQSSNVFSIMSNVTPVGAIALFGGCYFADKWKAFLVPLLSLWISDILLNRILYFDHWSLFYEGSGWIYGSFALIVVIGQLMKKVTFTNVIVAAIAAALVHWLVADFGMWIGGGRDITTGLPFTKDLSGLIKCYGLALPFLKNMLIGNLVFSGLLFGAFEWMQRKYPALQLQRA